MSRTIIMYLPKRKVEAVQLNLDFGFKQQLPLCLNVEHYKSLSYL